MYNIAEVVAAYESQIQQIESATDIDPNNALYALRLLRVERQSPSIMSLDPDDRETVLEVMWRLESALQQHLVS